MVILDDREIVMENIKRILVSKMVGRELKSKDGTYLEIFISNETCEKCVAS
jgi:hypothetical protein